MIRTRYLERWLVAPVLMVACLVPTTTNAGAARLESGGCSRFGKPTVKMTYDAERIRVVAHFTKCLEDGEPTSVSAGLSRASLEGAGAVRVMAQNCDRSWPCKLVVRMTHPDIERAEYEFNVGWTGLNGREQNLSSGPTWCTSTPVVAQCDESAIP